MESFLIKERYKVTRVLYAEKDYAALQAVDILSREKTEYLLNVYEGEYLKEYLGCFDRLKFCPEFKGLQIAGESLVAVFDYRRGVDIDQVFYKGAELDWHFRLKTAEALFHLGLSMVDFPPEIACTAFLSENIQIYPNEDAMGVSFVVKPMRELSEREMIFLLSDQIKKVLIKRWSSPKPERRFVAELSRGTETSVVALYSKWTEARKEIQEAYETIDGKPALGRLLYLLFMNLSCAFGVGNKRKEA